MSLNTIEKDRETVRINLEVSPHVRDHIKDLRKRSDAASLAEVFKKSLALYDLVLTFTSQGGKVVLESPSGEREVIRLL
jgi:hypothetical protein